VTSSSNGGGGGGGYVAYWEPLGIAAAAYKFGGGGDGENTGSGGGSVGGGGGGDAPGGSSGISSGGSTNAGGSGSADGTIAAASGGAGGGGGATAVLDSWTTIEGFNEPTVTPGTNGTYPAGGLGGNGGSAEIIANDNVSLNLLTMSSGMDGNGYFALVGHGGSASFITNHALDAQTILLEKGNGALTFTVDTLIAAYNYTLTQINNPTVSIAEYHFDVTGIQTGQRLLNVTGTPLPLTDSTPITLLGIPDDQLDPEDVFTLIQGVSGTFTATQLSLGTHKFEVELRSGSLFAEYLGDFYVPPPPGGGGGGGSSSFAVTFDTKGGGTIPKQIVYYGDTATLPAAPDREGYTFGGWYLDGEAFDFKTKITENTALTAVWTASGETDTAVPLPGDIDGDTALHIWYLQGDEKGQLRPDAPITRAEVAMIFYRLLDNSSANPGIYANFPDVDANAWYGQAVNALAGRGILKGYEDGTFRPADTITRAEFTAVAARFGNLPLTGTTAFPDVPANDWAFSYIASARETAWVDGLPDGLFHPVDNIDRASVAKIVNNALDRHCTDIPEARQFPDLASNHWAYHELMEASTTHTVVNN
jgi:uncharacterized repeat protein (TIGR02543 family)